MIVTFVRKWNEASENVTKKEEKKRKRERERRETKINASKWNVLHLNGRNIFDGGGKYSLSFLSLHFFLF